MSLKFKIYLIFITLFSFFSFFKGAEGILLTFSLLVLAVINYSYLNFYVFFIGIQKSSVSNGLFYSSVVGAILFIPLFLKDFSYQMTGMGNVDLSIPFGILIYLLSMIICFSIDAFFSKDVKSVKRSRIALGSFLFYLGLYFINAFISVILAGVHVLGFS